MHCYFCHGYAGDAKTVASGYLNPPPRDFTTTDPAQLSRDQMVATVRNGKTDTAMMGFATKLSAHEINAVIDFIRHNFMEQQHYNTHYHTEENGWYDFSRYAAAFPFISGERAMNDVDLGSEEQQGLSLFIDHCLTCHEGRSLESGQLELDHRPVSYPRAGYSARKDDGQIVVQIKDQGESQAAIPIDSISAASPYARHEVAPQGTDLSPQQREGERLFQANCAFCHGADGTGKNWIGSFLQPHPRNLNDANAMQGMTPDRLQDVISNGLEGTTMSAWKSVLTRQQIEAISAYVMRVFVPVSDTDDYDD